MAEPEPAQTSARTRGDDSLRGIRAIRRSLGLDRRQADIVRSFGDRLAPFVDGWVDRFYTRLLVDPVAQRLLEDEGRVVRLKRSLSAWFHEIFSLPFDEDYERARTTIGRSHVTIGMPAHLMVTAMGALRRDVGDTIRESLAVDVDTRRGVARAMSLVLDMELALMLEAYRRQERRVLREKDRAIYGERALRLLAMAQRDRLDAALCYAEMALDADGRPARKLLVEMRDLLRELGRAGQPLATVGMLDAVPVGPTNLLELCRKAFHDVSFESRTRVVIDVAPDGLTMRLRSEAVRLAVEEMLQNAATHGVGAEVRLVVRGDEEVGQASIEVRDAGSGWSPGIEHLRDVYAEKSGLGLSFCELVAEIHEGRLEIFDAPGGGAGVRLVVQEVGD